MIFDAFLFGVEIVSFTLIILFLKYLISLFFKKIDIIVLVSSTLLTAPTYFFIIFGHELLFGRLSFYTYFLLVLTVSLFEYNIMLKRLYKRLSSSTIVLFLFASNTIAYGLAELINIYFI
ncbi:MAG: hypothetical protein AB7E16_00670 [Candidatus Izemoplasmatales bacterium]|jgi:hypothetical protein